MLTKSFSCPFCSKKATRGTGLASHIRSAHPDQYSTWKEQLSGKPTPPAFASAPEQAEHEAPVKHTAGTAKPTEDHSTKQLLGQAHTQLSERKRAIEEELSRFNDLTKELETISVQLDSLNNTLGVFEIQTEPEDAGIPEEPPAQKPAQSVKREAKSKFAGSKRELVSSVVELSGSTGATPKDIADMFSKRGIAKGRNLIYNALSLFVKQGKMRREDGKYYLASEDAPVSTKPAKASSKQKAKGAKKKGAATKKYRAKRGTAAA